MKIFKELLSNQLKVLSNKEQSMFAFLICDRLYPNYLYFSNLYNFGNSKKVKECVDYLCQYLVEDKKLKPEEVNAWIKSIESITPDTEDYNTILVSFALDACTSLISSLQFLLDGDISNILDVSNYATDTVDMFIQERDNMDYSNKNFELIIQNDVLMVKEKNRQLKSIEILNQKRELNSSLLYELQNIEAGPIINVNIFKS